MKAWLLKGVEMAVMMSKRRTNEGLAVNEFRERTLRYSE